mgnify:CR=1 FL=1
MNSAAVKTLGDYLIRGERCQMKISMFVKYYFNILVKIMAFCLLVVYKSSIGKHVDASSNSKVRILSFQSVDVTLY